MPQDVLSNLVQSGALNVWNPMEAYKQATTIGAMQGKMEETKLSNEDMRWKLMAGSLNNVRTKDELPKWMKYAKERLGAPDEMMPAIDSIRSDEELEDLKDNFSKIAPEIAKVRQGQKGVVTRVYPDGTITHEPLTAKEIIGLQKLGFKEGKDFFMGALDKESVEKEAERKRRVSQAQAEGEIAGGKETPEERLNRDKELARYKESIKSPTEKAGSDFERAYQDWAKKPDNKGKAREEFKRTEWEKQKEPTLSKMELATKAAGVDLAKAAKGEITKEEAEAILEKLTKADLLETILQFVGSNANSSTPSEVKYDKDGKRIK